MRRLLLVLVPLVVVAAGVAGWWWYTRENFPPPPPWSEDMQTVADGNNRFAFDLYAKLRDREDGNLFFSPYSAHTALAMTATGARGKTRDEMVKVLHLPADEQKALASGDLGAFYAHPRKDFELSVANAIWGQKAYPWRSEFLELQKARFASAFNEADFKTDPDGERKRVNTWAEEQTRGKIKDLLPEGIISQMTRMVLANAIYFKGAWEKQFDPKHTRPMPFTLSTGTKVDVPMMHRESGFKHYVQPGQPGRFEPEFQVAELSYRGGELSMVILLPGKHDGLRALEAKLEAKALADWLAKAREEKDLDLYLPKFRIETPEMMLNEPLKQLGMVLAFDQGRADLTGLHSGNEQLFVSAVVQKAFVDVNEEGTEAAAATAVAIDAKSARLDFRADRPFLFLIRDVKHGTILFLGRVTNPKP